MKKENLSRHWGMMSVLGLASCRISMMLGTLQSFSGRCNEFLRATA